MLDVGTERFLLKKLFEDGPMTERQLDAAIQAAGIGIDRSPTYMAEWCVSAAERGLIKPTTGSTAVKRWNITDVAGSAIVDDGTLNAR